MAIVGHSGSGKSTIASLILRFYDSSRGQIVIDGQELKKISVPFLRDQISIVQQEPLLFNETIKQNIKFGNLKAADIEIRSVASQANAMGFIMQNDDDVSAPSVQHSLMQTYRRVSDELIRQESQFPNFVSIPQLVEKKQVQYKELASINDLLPNLSVEGLTKLE